MNGAATYPRPRSADEKQLERAYFPSGLPRDPHVSPTAKMVAALLGMCDTAFAEAELLDTHYIERPPTQDEIAGWLGLSNRHVRYAFSELKTAQYLVVKRRRQGRPRYLFRAPQMALELGERKNQDRQRVAGPDRHMGAGPDRQMGAGPDRQPCADLSNIVRRSFITNNDDEKGPTVEPSPSSSLLEQNGLTPAQIAVAIALRSPDQIAEQVAALPYRRPRKPAATLFAALRDGWELPEEYLKARARAAAARVQLELRAATDLERRAAAREDEAAAAVSAEDRRAQLPENMRRRLNGAAVGAS